MSDSLAEALPKEQKRCREALSIYKSIPQGAFGALMIEQSLERADKAVMSGDVIEMLKSYKELKNISV